VGVADHVGERLAHHGQQVGADIVGHGVVDRAVEVEARLEAEGGRGLSGERKDPGSKPALQRLGALQGKDRRADLADGLIEVGHGLGDPFRELRWREPDRRFEGEAGGEEPLDDRVVQVGGDPFAVLDQRHVADARVQAGVLDGDPGGAGQGDGQGLVFLAELRRPLLVGQIQVAEHLTADANGHAEEGRHRRVPHREAVAVGVGVEVGEPQRCGFDDQHPQNPKAFRIVADLGDLLGLESDVDELGQAEARLVEHAERAVPGSDQRDRGFDDAPQGRGERRVRSDGLDGVDEAAEPVRVLGGWKRHQDSGGRPAERRRSDIRAA